MPKRPLSPSAEVPPAHRSPYTGPIGSPPRYRSPLSSCDDCPSYSPSHPAYTPHSPYYGYCNRPSPAYSPTGYYHLDLNVNNVPYNAYEITADPHLFVPIHSSLTTRSNWPCHPKAMRPPHKVPEFNDDVECEEVALLCK
mgnify:CR=1 FL=1